MVPRIIHQIYLQGQLPQPLRMNVDNLRATNPDWQHRLYSSSDADALVADYGPEIAKAYHRIDPAYGAARADLLRELIIYRFGGVYCDIKSGFMRPLDEVLRPDDTYILSQWRNAPGEPYEGFGLHADLSHVRGGEFVTHFIIAEAHHPFTFAVIETILRNVSTYRPWSAVGRNGVLRTTGPIAYTLAINKILDQQPHRFATSEELGAYFSVSDYDHQDMFPDHYSHLSAPVVKLGRSGAALSKLFVALRSLKHERRKTGERRARDPSKVATPVGR